ncbi:hypothetical protein HC928_01305 [bacterium]|nr:hypothetical protein [bacterium]
MKRYTKHVAGVGRVEATDAGRLQTVTIVLRDFERAQHAANILCSIGYKNVGQTVTSDGGKLLITVTGWRRR